MLTIYICTFLFLIKPNIVVLLNSSDLSKPNFGENFPVAISKSKLPSKTLQVCNDGYFLHLNPHFFIKPSFIMEFVCGREWFSWFLELSGVLLIIKSWALASTFEKLRQIQKVKVIRLSLNTLLRLLAHNMCRVVACPGRDKLARAQLCKNKYLFWCYVRNLAFNCVWK